MLLTSPMISLEDAQGTDCPLFFYWFKDSQWLHAPIHTPFLLSLGPFLWPQRPLHKTFGLRARRFCGRAASPKPTAPEANLRALFHVPRSHVGLFRVLSCFAAILAGSSLQSHVDGPVGLFPVPLSSHVVAVVDFVSLTLLAHRANFILAIFLLSLSKARVSVVDHPFSLHSGYGEDSCVPVEEVCYLAHPAPLPMQL